MKWILVKDRLPEYEGWYLIYNPRSKVMPIDVAHFVFLRGKKYFQVAADGVTHWHYATPPIEVHSDQTFLNCRWEPKLMDFYFYIQGYEVKRREIWSDGDYREDWNNYNCFQTFEDANKALDIQKKALAEYQVNIIKEQLKP